MDRCWSGLLGHDVTPVPYVAGRIGEIGERGVVLMVPSVHLDGTIEISIDYAIDTQPAIATTQSA